MSVSRTYTCPRPHCLGLITVREPRLRKRRSSGGPIPVGCCDSCGVQIAEPYLLNSERVEEDR